jgi:Domain of unknown function (DUF4132)
MKRMNIFDKAKVAIEGVLRSPSETVMARAKKALKGHDYPDAGLFINCLYLRLQSMVGDGPREWVPVQFKPLWDGSTEQRTDALQALAHLFSTGFFPQTKEYVWSSEDYKSADGLVRRLEGDVRYVVCEVMRRKVNFSDKTGAEIARQFGDHYGLVNLHVLNKLLSVSSNPTYPLTQQRLRVLRDKFEKEKHWSNRNREVFQKLSEALTGKPSEKLTSQNSPPRVKWVTWNSLQKIILYYSEIDIPEKISANHISALDKWSIADPVRERGVGFARYNQLKADIPKAGSPAERKELEEEYEDLSGPDYLTREFLLRELQPILSTVKKLNGLSLHQQALWFKFTTLSSTLPKSGGPSQKWLASIKTSLSKGELRMLPQYLEQVALVDDWSPRQSGAVERTLRALIFSTLHLPGETAGKLLARFAEKTCYKSIPQLGLANEKLGNACLWALINRDDGAGVPYLSRLLTKVKYPKIRKIISQALDEAAAKAKITRGQLEEQAVSNHGLEPGGHKIMKVGSGSARIAISGTSSTEITWGLDSTAFKTSIPAALKDRKSDIQAVRAEAKDIENDLSAQVLRLQRIWLEDRRWTAEEWRQRYLDHPLMGGLSRRLIWTSKQDGEARAFSCYGGTLMNVDGKQLDISGSTIHLWHPVEWKLKDVLAWRERIRKLGMVQPFKQAHREIYLVTPAELNTNTYSNRFAGHILKQHQMVALARTNAWNATLRIAADVANDAPTHIVLPAHGIVAEYWVEAAGVDEDQFNDAGAYLYLTTDRLCFYRYDTGAPQPKSTAYGPTRGDIVPIKDVPLLVLSEVMRQCDLFVGVASVANDPNWRDGGTTAEHPNQWRTTVGVDYWNKQAFGELDQASNMRAEFLAEILPALAIAPVCKIEGRFLHVKGKLRTYKIHIGSGNILMMPNDAYLCIVPSSRDKSEPTPLTLPFEGDSKLSIVISKAILLAADNKIIDQTILQQINRK